MEKMPVLFDYQAFEMQRMGGVSRYFCELMCRIKRPYLLSLKSSSNYYVEQYGRGDKVYKLPLFLHKLFKKQNIWVNRRYSEKMLEKSTPYLLHPTYYDPYFLKYINKNPYIVTVHDMNHELMPQYFRDALRVTAIKKEVILGASRIIAISENTRQDILRILPINPEKIEVIYHGASVVMNKYDGLLLPEQYLLFVGERGGYKNFDRLLLAYKQIVEYFIDLKLVCVGRPFRKYEHDRLKELGLHSRVVQIQPNEEELSQLYRQAILFVYPSLYEGFGFPILEAYANRCPVVLSETSCFPEIAGTAGSFFNPYSVEDMAGAIYKVLADDNYRNTLVNSGAQRLRQYSWEKTIEQTEKVYDFVEKNYTFI